MTILSVVTLVLAVSALAVTIALQLRQVQLNSRLNALEQTHASAGPQQLFDVAFDAVENSEFEFPGVNVSYNLLGQQKIRIIMDNYSGIIIPNAEKLVTISVPGDTTHVIPCMIGYMAMYGQINSINDDGTLDVRMSDGHLGAVYANMGVADVGDGSATIRARMFLGNTKQDADWTGLIDAVVLSLQLVNT